jgi:hypothetical protein
MTYLSPVNRRLRFSLQKMFSIRAAEEVAQLLREKLQLQLQDVEEEEEEVDLVTVNYVLGVASTATAEEAVETLKTFFGGAGQLDHLSDAELMSLIVGEQQEQPSSSPPSDSCESSGNPSPPRSSSQSPDLREGDEDTVNLLSAMFPDLSRPDIEFVLYQCCKGDQSTAINSLLESSPQLIRARRLLWEKEKEERERDLAQIKGKIVDRWADQTVYLTTSAPKTSVVAPMSIGYADVEKKTRYRDGRVVSTKGDKVIVVDETPEWDGGSRGRVKTKGKRGKGWR